MLWEIEKAAWKKKVSRNISWENISRRKLSRKCHRQTHLAIKWAVKVWDKCWGLGNKYISKAAFFTKTNSKIHLHISWNVYLRYLDNLCVIWVTLQQVCILQRLFSSLIFCTKLTTYRWHLFSFIIWETVNIILHWPWHSQCIAMLHQHDSEGCEK